MDTILLLSGGQIPTDYKYIYSGKGSSLNGLITIDLFSTYFYVDQTVHLSFKDNYLAVVTMQLTFK